MIRITTPHKLRWWMDGAVTKKGCGGGVVGQQQNGHYFGYIFFPSTRFSFWLIARTRGAACSSRLPSTHLSAKFDIPRAPCLGAVHTTVDGSLTLKKNAVLHIFYIGWFFCNFGIEFSQAIRSDIGRNLVRWVLSKNRANSIAYNTVRLKCIVATYNKTNR